MIVGSPCVWYQAAYEVIGRCLARRVRGMGRIGRGLVKRRVVRTEAAVHFISRHMDQAKTGLPRGVQNSVVGRGRVQQAAGPHDVGPDKILGRDDRAIDMRLGRQVKHDGWLKIGEDAGQLGGIANVRLDESVLGMCGQVGQAIGLGGIRQLVVINHRRVRIG